MSLSQTCLGCHSNKEKFCDACHNYSGSSPTAGAATCSREGVHEVQPQALLRLAESA